MDLDYVKLIAFYQAILQFIAMAEYFITHQMIMKNMESLVSKGYKRQQIDQNTALHCYKVWSKDIKSEDITLLIKVINLSEEQKKEPQVKLVIQLYHNSIGAEGCKYLVQASWNNIQQLDIGSNNIGSKGCRLSKALWSNLIDIQLGGNNIGAQGCLHLIQTQWPCLRKLSLWNNMIGSIGCKYLVKAKWKDLQNLALWDNNIGAEGCRQFAKAEWSKLEQIAIWNNTIGINGYRFIKKLNWKIECEWQYKQDS